ncbi:MAG: hypothetical protein SNJ52_01760, partial [Verrucomicrobiia bacterium]
MDLSLRDPHLPEPQSVRFPFALRARWIFLVALTFSLISPLRGETASEEGRIYDPTQTADLRALQGEEVTVRGRVDRVGVGPGGVIHFINFVGTRRGDFTVIVRRNRLAHFQDPFGAEFPVD